MGKLDRLAQSIGANITDNLSGTSEQSAPDGPKLPVRLQGITKAKNTAQIPIAKIIADVDQPRETMEAEGLEALAASIMTHGILQPLLVRWSEETSVYILIAGERRWRAAQKAKLQSVPCVIREGDLDASARLTLQIVENEMHEAISPLELAAWLSALLMDLQGWSAGQLSSELHIPKEHTRTLELLGLPTEIQTKVDQASLLHR